MMFQPQCAECSFVRKYLDYHVGDEVFTVNAGDCLYLPPAIPHQLYNPGDVEVRVIGAITPPCF
jgi:mannose-6-phosphate isomerase-like protein (cupin superfamily)